MGAEEMFQIVDEEGTVIGEAPRSQCHGDPSLLHTVAHVLVFRGDGSLVLQKRHLGKDICPGLWDTSAAGHARPEEQPKQAAARELREELGVSYAPLRFLYQYIWRTEVESEMVFTYKAYYDGACRLDPEEVADARDWTVDEIEAALGTGVFTENFEHEWGIYTRYARRQAQLD